MQSLQAMRQQHQIQKTDAQGSSRISEASTQ